MTDPTLREQARQGNPTAIASLLTRSFQAQNIRAQVGRQEAQLFVRLVHDTQPPAQNTIVPRIVYGLQRLEIQGISTVHIQAQALGGTGIAWQTRVELSTGASSVSSSSATGDSSAEANQPSPSPPANPSPGAVEPNIASGSNPNPPSGGTPSESPEPSSPLILPGWSFWFGWVAVLLISASLAAGVQAIIFDSLNINGNFRILIFSALAESLIGVGQWLVLRQEVSWAKRWLEATILGAIAASVLEVIRLLLWQSLLSPLPSLGGLKTLVSLIMRVAAMAPIFIGQWRVLRRHLGIESATLWVRSIVVITFLVFFLQTFNVERFIPFYSLDAQWLWSLGRWMASGAVMVYLLRQYRVELLKLNRLTDATTRRRLLQQRAKINGQFFLEWAGLTLVGWVVSAIIGPALSLATFGISAVFSVVIVMGVGAGFQWIALKRRINESEFWFIATISTAFTFTLIGLVLSFILGGLALRSIAVSASPTSGYWPYFASLGIAAFFIAIAWFAVIAAQSRVLYKQGYRPSWWILINLGTLCMLAFESALRQGLVIIPGLLVALVLLPAAGMVWLMGYPKKLHPMPGIWTE
ncbi:MAG: hypothetical protein AAFY26_07645 [Cyanobacteria bacterium J06638_22]